MGRVIKEFKSSDHIYMPEFMGYSVTSETEWNDNIKSRLDKASPQRYEHVKIRSELALQAESDGKLISHEIDGGFMFLRDLLGPENLLYTFIDNPSLIHDMMEAWTVVHEALIKEYLKYISIDELFLKEDICYKSSSLISPDMIEDFLFPYYRRLINLIKNENKNKTKKLYLAMDSDGHIESVLELYIKLGFTIFSPFEVAASCDVVEIGKKYPNIVICGGFDKRILAKTKADIEKEMLRIMPIMKERGGYFPTCDHGVPEDVSYENYLYFRELCKKYE